MRRERSVRRPDEAAIGLLEQAAVPVFGLAFGKRRRLILRKARHEPAEMSCAHDPGVSERKVLGVEVVAIAEPGLDHLQVRLQAWRRRRIPELDERGDGLPAPDQARRQAALPEQRLLDVPGGGRQLDALLRQEGSERPSDIVGEPVGTLVRRPARSARRADVDVVERDVEGRKRAMPVLLSRRRQLRALRRIGAGRVGRRGCLTAIRVRFVDLPGAVRADLAVHDSQGTQSGR